MFGSMRITAFMLTDQGRVREHNEDFIDCREPASQADRGKNGWLYILADGVGGADAGEVASQYATERTIYHYFANDQEESWGRRLHEAMQTANTELRQLSMKNDTGKRMATTMVAVILHDNNATIANVGDSRGYHWREGQLRQVTRDQSLVARLVEEGAITEEEALIHPRKNVILHSLGSEKSPEIDLYELDLISGDQLILCSDGLTRHVTDEEITNAVENLNPELATKLLVELANNRGGEDNISVTVLQIEEQPVNVETVPAPRAMSSGEPLDRMDPSQANFWIYSAILAIVQIVLIVLVWNLVNG
jgi:protein phosphatase